MTDTTLRTIQMSRPLGLAELNDVAEQGPLRDALEDIERGVFVDLAQAVADHAIWSRIQLEVDIARLEWEIGILDASKAKCVWCHCTACGN